MYFRLRNKKQDIKQFEIKLFENLNLIRNIIVEAFLVVTATLEAVFIEGFCKERLNKIHQYQLFKKKAKSLVDLNFNQSTYLQPKMNFLFYRILYVSLFIYHAFYAILCKIINHINYSLTSEFCN
ncbi:hypothetical protein BpHYR1_017473 [Brachionus plicatilis]|uniref:Transmembrane protein n=1 Tax=Brachionus plicatilis TaxID=10195 RepID=A0A3M7PJJ0_BRAPC|nr:hypothetical protein BpHYR1_017473 [Brachionus plicatilis]